MKSRNPRNSPFRVGVMLDLTWNLKRHTDVFAGVARYAQEHADLRCLIDDFATDTLEQDKGKRRPYDGVIGRVTPRLQQLARRRKLPLVNVWQSSPVQNVPSVFANHRASGEMLAEHMLARGIRRFLSLVRRRDVGENIAAHRLEEIAAGQGAVCDRIRLPLLFAHSPSRWRETRSTIEGWLGTVQPPVGVFTGVDILARYLAQICDEMGLRVPQDVAIVGGFNEPTICLYPEPTLSSIEFGFDQIGYAAAGMMHRLLKQKRLDREVIHLPPRELVVRQSSDFVYVDEEIVSAAMQFISQNVRWPMGVEEVAAAAGTSRRTLELRFQKHLGRSVAAEIRRVRLDQAKRLLASSGEPIASIARQSGIGSPQQFARVFRREVGISPRAYRRQFVDRS